MKSQATAIFHGIIIHGDTIFVSSVTGLNKKGELVCGGVKEQAVKVLDNLKCILESVGASLMSVVKTNIMLTNIEDTEDIHEIYSTLKLPGSRRQTSDVDGMGRNAATLAEIRSRYLRRRRRHVMGCTSSTQHLHTPTSTQHKAMTDDVKSNTEIESPTQINTKEHIDIQGRINELPTCDKDDNASDVEQSEEKSNNMELKKNIKDEFGSKIVDIEDCIHIENNTEGEDRFSKLEEVVEKVVELYVVDSLPNTDEPSIATEKEQNLTETTAILTENKLEENVQEADERQEAASPSESASSRATRWEALADIAAELPPSLAVDPLTGQIYVLSK